MNHCAVKHMLHSQWFNMHLFLNFYESKTSKLFANKTLYTLFFTSALLAAKIAVALLTIQ